MAIRDILLLIIASTIWGLNFAIAKLGMEQLPPLFLSAMRFSVVALAVFFIPRPKISWHILVNIAIFLGVIKFSLLFIALDIGFSAGLSSVVVQGQVFFTIILTFLFYGERINQLQISGLLIGFIGLVIMGFDNGASFNLTGFFMVVLAALCWATANMFFRQIGNAPALAVITWVSLLGAGPIWILSFIFEGPSRILDTFTDLDLMSILAILYISLLSTLFSYSIWGKMLTRYRASDVTPFALLVPVSGLLGGIILLDEKISILAQIGICIIMAGLIITMIGGRISRKQVIDA